MAEVEIGTFRAELASPSVLSSCQFNFILRLLNLPFNPPFRFLCCLHSAGVEISLSAFSLFTVSHDYVLYQIISPCGLTVKTQWIAAVC